MAWRIEFIPAAERDLAGLDPQTRRRVLLFLRERVAGLENPRVLGAPLRNARGQWRYRVGDWRIVARIEDDVVRVLVVRVAHRREVYRNA